MMKRLAFLFAAVTLAAPLAQAQASTWMMDPAHSEVGFTIRHMSVSNVHGRFGKLIGNVHFDESDATKSSVEVTIDVTALDTGDVQRDTHIKGPDFFDVAKFPTAAFTSTGVMKAGNHLRVTGNLTLHGVTKPVELDVEGPGAPVPGMDHKPHEGYSATATIQRTDFGIGAKFPAAVVGDEVKLTIDLEVVKQ